MAQGITERYDNTTIALHWATALSVAALWIIGQTADWFPRGSAPKQAYWSLHVVLGFALAVVVAARMTWRAGGGRALPAIDHGLTHSLAKATHYLLYALVTGVVVLGIVNAFVRGYSIFGLFHLPQLGDYALRGQITYLHGLVANVLLGLAMFHAAAALVHHYLWHDGLLVRMMPKFKVGGR